MPEEIAAAGSAEPQSDAGSAGDSHAQHPSQEFGESEHSDSQQQEQQRPESQKSGTDSKPKGKSRYARAREWRQALEQREATLAQRERAWTEREAQAAQAKKPSYTLEELRQYREQWAQEAEYDPAKAQLVAKADVEIQKMEALEQREAGSKSFRTQWEQAEAALAKEDPDFLKQGSALDKKIREILADPNRGPHYRSYPLGIIAVYDAAIKELQKGELDVLRTKVRKFETENKRLNGLTSIGGGSPGQFGANGGGNYTPEQFSKLSAKQMKDHLLRDARR